MSRRGEMKLDTEVPTTRRERATNWGATEDVMGGERGTLFTMSSQQSDSVTIYVEAELDIPDELLGTADFRPILRVSWGQGGSSAQSDYDATYRQRIPLASALTEVSCWIAALPLPNVSTPIPGGPRQIIGAERGPFMAPKSVTCHFRAFVAQGCDGIGQLPTFWFTQLAMATGQYAVGSVRLASFRAHNPQSGESDEEAAPKVWLLLFDEDTLPAPGDIPKESMFLPYAELVVERPLAPEQLDPTHHGTDARLWPRPVVGGVHRSLRV